MAEAQPLAAMDLSARLAGIVATDASGLVLAVSGGPDSMALLHLAADLAGLGRLPPVTVATVDHGLRPNSADDGARVAAAAAALGLSCRRLAWTGPKPVCAIQERAREARYRLLTALCAEIGADHLVTAHTLDDQAETVLFRLLRGSGVSGLAGMDGVTDLDGVRLVRPFLDLPKDRLVATCRSRGVAIVDDPANVDPRFARARLRRLLPLLAAEGFGPVGIARLARRLSRADEALTRGAEDAFGACTIDGSALDGRRLAALPRETAIRLVARVVAEGGGSAGRLDRLERLTGRITAAAAARTGMRATLGGALLTLAPDGRLSVSREAPRRRGRSRGSVPLTIPATNPPCGASAPASFPWQV